MRVISVASGKGGVGKTTAVANLGIILASKYKKNVILMDCNITTPHLGLYMGIDHHPVTLNHLLKGKARVSDAVYPHHSGVKVIPSSLSLKDLDGVDVANMKQVINKIKRAYPETDFLIIDCAPGLGREAMAGIRSSEEILYITTPYFPIVVDMVKCNQVASELGLKKIGAVVNMKNNNKHQLSDIEIEHISEIPVIGTVPHHQDVLKSLHKRIPVSIHSPRSIASLEFERIAAKIAGEKVPPGGFVGLVLRIFEQN